MADGVKKASKAFELDAKIMADINNDHNSTNSLFNHVIFFIHGVENDGTIPNTLVKSLNKHLSNCVIKPLSYGSLPYYRCIFNKQRKKVVSDFLQDNKAIIESSDYSNIEVSFICHSCGTQIFSEIISNLSIPFLKYIIFCGSIVNRKYDFNKNIFFINKNSKVINECGSKDCIPSIAASITRNDLFDSSGSSKGFTSGLQRVHDRHHNCGHNDFFKEDFIKRFWVPIFEDNDIVLNSNYQPNKRISAFHKIVERINLYHLWKIILLLIIGFWWLC